ncbi:Transcription repressor OFP13 [Zea mays]|uniref:Transcription repressor n=1 Tax=Zea mays TaxID=4577 RepID=A0A3L6GAX5_MAIZE|nr:Transcription repressor OFP13 [Zea mays]
MVRKLALASLFFNASEGSQCLSSSASFSTAASWQWPSCTQARTRSFRGEIVSMRHVDTSSKREEQEGYKTSMNPAYVVHDCYSSSSAAPAEPAADEDEAIIHGLRSSTTRRLLFEPESTSSIVKKTKKEAAFSGATALAIESADPYGDFRRSMEEMVLSHGAGDDWAWLEEMLGWYLRANGKRTHGLIVGAFVDLLVALASSSAPSPAVCSSSLKQSSHLILEAANIES